MSTLTSKDLATIAANRFGLGATKGEIASAQKNPKAWLKEQLVPVSFDKGLPNSDQITLQINDLNMQKKMLKKDRSENGMAAQVENNKKRTKLIKSSYVQLATDSFVQALNSKNSLSWRLLDFYSNHFSVSGQGPVMKAIAPTLEREAIAPNLHGKFEQMLIAVIQHPTMLIYLNNERSYGENSRLGKNGKGLNENLAREILELHTLGVDAGYNQQDVIELAKGITGWSVAHPRRDKTTGFKFRAWGKEPGTRTLLGKQYPQADMSQGIAMLKDLANHPNTAKHICTKLVKHFISDQPNKDLVDAMTKVWLKTGGDLKQVTSAMIDNDLAWQAESQKFKTPREYLMSTLRALNLKNINHKKLLFTLESFGQQPFQAGSPKGYSDEQQDWDGSNSLMSKIDWTAMLARQMRKANAENIMNNSLALSADSSTYKSIVRAESRSQAFVMLFLSPEFLRR